MSEINSVSFFTPVSFGDKSKSFSETLLEYADDYFYLGGRKACVISNLSTDNGREVTYKDDSPSFLATALKVLTYVTLVIPLIVLALKTLLRLTHDFKLDDRSRLYGLEGAARTEKVKEIMAEKIPEDVDEIIKKIITQEGRAKDSDFLEKNSGSVRLTALPNLLIYTNVKEEELEKMFAERVRLQQVCLDEGLNLISLPAVKLITIEIEGKPIKFLVEEYIAYNSSRTAQQLFYSDYSGLNNTVEQLVTFIAKAGLEQVYFDDFPLIDDAEDFSGDRRITLKGSPKSGDASQTIFNLLYWAPSEEMVDLIIAEAARHGIEGTEDATAAQFKERVMSGIISVQALSKGVEVSASAKALIGEALANKLSGIEKEVKGDLVNFSLAAVPGLVFTTQNDYAEQDGLDDYNSLVLHFRKVEGLVDYCSRNSLDRFNLPLAKLIRAVANGKEVLLIAQQDLQSDRKQNVEEQLEKVDDTTLQQLIQFMEDYYTGADPLAAFSVLDSNKVTLVDFSLSRRMRLQNDGILSHALPVDMNMPLTREDRLVQPEEVRAFINCLNSEKLIDRMLAQAEALGYKPTADIKAERMAQIAQAKQTEATE
jgi:hypothetical protein